MRLPFPAVCLLAAASLHADALSDLQETLKKLEGREPVKVQADYQFWNQDTEDKKPKVTQGQAQAFIEDGPSGLRLGWSRQELEQLDAASRKGKAARNAKTQALGAFSAGKAEEVVDGARTLLEALEGATVAEDRQEAWQGHPARLLVLKLDPHMDEGERKHIKRLDKVLKLWLGPDGVPMAAEEQLDLKGSFFLISFEMHRKASRSYLRAGGRLLLTREESEESGSGMGQSQQQKSVLTAKPA
ncbi:MAG TPA: hypothetical protein VJ600_04685 [Holophagaceae bacterium]|nr:hypothetical protein [Holophagaceae bacterium]